MTDSKEKERMRLRCNTQVNQSWVRWDLGGYDTNSPQEVDGGGGGGGGSNAKAIEEGRGVVG
jgi:hypothetical protein